MIARYFEAVEALLKSTPNIQSLSIKKISYNALQGYISATLVFEQGDRFDFMEVVNTSQASKIKYRYHYMDAQQVMVFRYDNAPHHQNVETFPHHKHIAETIVSSSEPNLEAVLLEIGSLQADDI